MLRTMCLAAGLLASGIAAGETDRAAMPHPACLDARAVERVRNFDPDTLLIAAAGTHFVVTMAKDCGKTLQGTQSLLAHEGWVCAGEREYVAAGIAVCPIAAVTPIPEREYARLALGIDRTQRGASDGVALAPVEVTAATRRAPLRLRGDPDYCFSSKALRGWHLSGNDLIVITAPRHAGGNRSYRVELAHSCPELTWKNEVGFSSGMGTGLICGNPGDKVFGTGGGAGGSFGSLGTGLRSGCAIAAVYPES